VRPDPERQRTYARLAEAYGRLGKQLRPVFEQLGGRPE
jgi:hypothetical protein